MSDYKNELRPEKNHRHSSQEDADDRITSIRPVIDALEFIRDEAKRRDNQEIYRLIDSAFSMASIAYEIIKKSKHN